jgi:hypothetical protein
MGFLTNAINDQPDIERDVHIADQFFVTVRWLSPKQRDEILKQCTDYKRGIPDINRERHARAFTKRAVRGWRGLTIDTLTGALKIQVYPSAYADLKKVQEDNNGQLPHTQEDSVLIYLNALPDRYANKIKEAMDDWDDDFEKQEEVISKK